jgi:hypothetical protein
MHEANVNTLKSVWHAKLKYYEALNLLQLKRITERLSSLQLLSTKSRVTVK